MKRNSRAISAKIIHSGELPKGERQAYETVRVEIGCQEDHPRFLRRTVGSGRYSRPIIDDTSFEKPAEKLPLRLIEIVIVIVQ